MVVAQEVDGATSLRLRHFLMALKAQGEFATSVPQSSEH
jgi:hypothetical protein